MFVLFDFLFDHQLHELVVNRAFIIRHRPHFQRISSAFRNRPFVPLMHFWAAFVPPVEVTPDAEQFHVIRVKFHAAILALGVNVRQLESGFFLFAFEAPLPVAQAHELV